jgi:endo-1,4-beta-xylanase
MLGTLLTITLLLADSPAFEEPGWVNPPAKPIPNVEHRILHSPSMRRDVGYCVYTPPEYAEEKTKRYPVIYFLHGMGGNESMDAGGFPSVLEKAMRAGKFPPAICVFPNGMKSEYRDDKAKNVLVETMIIRELLPRIDRDYRTIAKREGRVVCGFSMGGMGALRFAFKYPDKFAGAASWGGTYRWRELADAAQENAPKIRKSGIPLLFITGSGDEPDAHNQLASALIYLQIPFRDHILPGVGHNLGHYYEQSGEAVLAFLGDTLKPNAAARP